MSLGGSVGATLTGTGRQRESTEKKSDIELRMAVADVCPGCWFFDEVKREDICSNTCTLYSMPEGTCAEDLGANPGSCPIGLNNEMCFMAEDRLTKGETWVKLGTGVGDGAFPDWNGELKEGDITGYENQAYNNPVKGKPFPDSLTLDETRVWQSLSRDGQRIVLTELRAGKDAKVPSEGRARVFGIASDGTWEQIGQDIWGTAAQQYTKTAALNYDGTVLAVGSNEAAGGG